MHSIDSIWLPALDLPLTNTHDIEERLKLHNMGIKIWANIWDRENNTLLSRADLIARYNLIDPQLDIVGRRLMLWHREDWWLMTVEDPHKL